MLLLFNFCYCATLLLAAVRSPQELLTMLTSGQAVDARAALALLPIAQAPVYAAQLVKLPGIENHLAFFNGLIKFVPNDVLWGTMKTKVKSTVLKDIPTECAAIDPEWKALLKRKHNIVEYSYKVAKLWENFRTCLNEIQQEKLALDTESAGLAAWDFVAELTPAPEDIDPAVLLQKVTDEIFSLPKHPGEHRISLAENEVLSGLMTEFAGIDNPLLLRRRIKVVNGLGTIDAGGVRRQVMTTAFRELSKPENKFFTTVGDDKKMWFHEDCLARYQADNAATLKDYKTIGRILGVALHHNFDLPVSFASPIYKAFVGAPVTAYDVILMYSLARARVFDLVKDAATDEDLELYCFSFIDPFKLGMETTDEINLVKHGVNIPVTLNNRKSFLRHSIDMNTYTRYAPMIDAMKAGVASVIPLEVLSHFSAKELDRFLSNPEPINVQDWKNNTDPPSTECRTHGDVIRWFWEYVDNASDETRRKILLLTTGSSSPPLTGFGDLPGGRFNFQCRITNNPELMYVIGGTCFSTLKIDLYQSQEEFNRYMEISLRPDILESFGRG